MLIDSHAHIRFEGRLDTQEIIKNMKSDGLEAIINVGTTLSDSRDAVRLAEENDGVYAIVGLHPESVDEFSKEAINEIRDLAKSPKVVAIGEIGLDYHWNSKNKQEQKVMFESLLEVAEEVGLPVCIHSRDAADDMFEILSKHASKLEKKGVLHCYGDGEKYAKAYTDLGYCISFAGNVTFKNYDRGFLKDLPRDQILVETDCPFLSPEPIRGRVNEPQNVKFTAEFLAREFGMEFEDFSTLTVENTKRVYDKIK
ncbi:MAG: TatD family hydrolase [Clostridia bacterium]|nr:TatD family hydrolase [Clostridia bacterium]